MKLERFDINARRSRMTTYNGVCYLSGQFSDNAVDVATQTRETLAKIDELCASSRPWNWSTRWSRKRRLVRQANSLRC